MRMACGQQRSALARTAGSHHSAASPLPAAGSQMCCRLPVLTSRSNTSQRRVVLTCRATAPEQAPPPVAEGTAAVRSKSERSSVRRRRWQGRSDEAPSPETGGGAGQPGRTAASLWALPEDAPVLEETGLPSSEQDREDRTAEASASGRGADTGQDWGSRARQDEQPSAEDAHIHDSGGAEAVSQVNGIQEHGTLRNGTSSAGMQTQALTSSSEQASWDAGPGAAFSAEADPEVVQPDVLEAEEPESVRWDTCHVPYRATCPALPWADIRDAVAAVYPSPASTLRAAACRVMPKDGGAALRQRCA